MPAATARRTRYAANLPAKICVLVELAEPAKTHGVTILTNTPEGRQFLAFKTRNPIADVTLETEGAKRWAAITMTRWLRNKVKPRGCTLPPVMTEWCRAQTIDTRSDSERWDDNERARAEYAVKSNNRGRLDDGQRWAESKRQTSFEGWMNA